MGYRTLRVFSRLIGWRQVGGFCLAELVTMISWRRLTDALLVFKIWPCPFVRILLPADMSCEEERKIMVPDQGHPRKHHHLLFYNEIRE